MGLFHNAQGLPDIHAQVQRASLEQSQVFRILAHGRLHVSREALLGAKEWARVLHHPSAPELETLVGLMEDERGRITIDPFLSVLRAWNIFNECDTERRGTLDAKETEILLWIYFRRKPDEQTLKAFRRKVEDSQGQIHRKDWVKAALAGQAVCIDVGLDDRN